MKKTCNQEIKGMHTWILVLKSLSWLSKLEDLGFVAFSSKYVECLQDLTKWTKMLSHLPEDINTLMKWYTGSSKDSHDLILEDPLTLLTIYWLRSTETYWSCQELLLIITTWNYIEGSNLSIYTISIIKIYRSSYS